MPSRLCRFPAYVSLSRLTLDVASSCIRCKMKLEPMNPAPPVTRIVVSMRFELSECSCSSRVLLNEDWILWPSFEDMTVDLFPFLGCRVLGVLLHRGRLRILPEPEAGRRESDRN